MHLKKAHKVILSIFLTILFLSLQFVVGGILTYAEGWKNYNSNGVNFETGSFIRSQGWHTPSNQFDTIQVFADQSGTKTTTIDNPTANGSYPTVSYSFVGAGFSSISSNFSYTSSKEVVVSGLSLGHMYTTYSNSGIEQVVKLDGPDANQSTNFSQISVKTRVRYYLEFGSIDTSIRPQFTATPSQYNGINYNLYSVDSQYISSEEGTYNLTGFNLGSEIRWPDDNMYGLTLVQDVNVPQNGVYISDSISVSSYQLKPIIASPGVVVKYVDESGNEVSTTETLSGNVGEAYTSTQKTISGYTFKE
ncbi:MucBP domain-containing protein, partial [Enterococcus faecalis]|nr:MucBP domain-containing protein [Enterococcus faecalis]EKZ0222031.1 MucBP domain-containing protein [Enterococcus faecalis]